MSWRDHVACEGADPELFFPDKNNETTRAQDEATIHRYCNRCQAKTECLQEALSHGARDQWGIQGGMTQDQRRELLGMPKSKRPYRRDDTATGAASYMPAEVEHRRMDAYARGLNDVQIAREVGSPVRTIQDWRNRRNLRPNHLMNAKQGRVS